jgi:hypothetical protein
VIQNDSERTFEDYRLLENREVLLIESAKSEMISRLLNIVVEKEISYCGGLS